jgi:hypothetical protein
MAQRHATWGSRGQTLAEVAIALPLLIVLMVGTMQVGWVLYQCHVSRKIAREGANMLSRQAGFPTTEAVIQGSQPYPGGTFNANAKLILSVVRLGTGGQNNGLPIITSRHSIGSLGGTSQIGDPGGGSYTGAPSYNAVNPNDDTAIRATLPTGLNLDPGQSVFVSELFTRRSDLASMSFWNVQFPNTLYARAMF